MKLFKLFIVACMLGAANVQAGVLVRFKMSPKIGSMDFELFDQDKPVTVSNFVAYVKAGLWHDQVFHRWQPGQFLQGGLFNVAHDPTFTTSWNTEPNQITPFPPIPFERDVGRFYSNVYGTIAMARVGTDTNSAAASWFMNVANNTFFDTQDGGYTVFGRILSGTNALNRFVPNTGLTNIYQVSGTEVPVYSEDSINVYLINSDITVLTARIQLARTGRDISWESVEGRANIVEFTRGLPAVWETLTTVTGTGATMSAFDASSDPMRFYRVRIVY
jgi:cyclophilin family peptidyl-prolyl cis-trans isomerase